MGRTDLEKSMKKHPNEDHLLFKINTGKTAENRPDIVRQDYWEYCDNCGQKLIIRKCRMICPQCGFFHSCSEP